MSLTAEQEDLRDAVRGLLAATGSSADDSAWPRLCREVGVAGLGIPERYGGAGAGPAETGVVMEELGRDLTPSPMLGSAVLAAQALLATGDEEACSRLLPAIAGGSATAALAWTTRAGRWDGDDVACVSRPSGAGDWELDGEAHYVLDGQGADVLLVAARGPEGVGLFEVDPVQDGVRRTAAVAMDATRRLAVVRLAGARGQRIGGDAAPALSRARDLACLALSAEQVGAARRALDLTVGYTMTRVQFGRVIGSFQALQHRLADLHVLVESARSLSRALASGEDSASWDSASGGSASGGSASGGSASGGSASGGSASGGSASGGSASGGSASGGSASGDAPALGLRAAGNTPALGLRAAAAKVYCSEALMRTAAEMIQLHGAIGITWEHQAHRYLKRAHGGLHLFGRPAQHAAAIAASLIDC